MSVHASINPLMWESQFFGIESAILHLADDAPLLDSTQLAHWARLQAKVPASRSDWLDALQQQGFRLVEGEVDFWLPVSKNAVDPQLSVALPADIAPLRALAEVAFSYSRFRAPWYASDASGRFYSRWVENAVLGTFDHQCLVVRQANGEPGAFVTLRQINAREARIGLLAGKGAGERLMQAACHWCAVRGIEVLRVATQAGNLAALQRYIRSGARVENTAYWLYR